MALTLAEKCRPDSAGVHSKLYRVPESGLDALAAGFVGSCAKSDVIDPAATRMLSDSRFIIVSLVESKTGHVGPNIGNCNESIGF
jgi:hypothetical protein